MPRCRMLTADSVIPSLGGAECRMWWCRVVDRAPRRPEDGGRLVARGATPALEGPRARYTVSGRTAAAWWCGEPAALEGPRVWYTGLSDTALPSPPLSPHNIYARARVPPGFFCPAPSSSPCRFPFDSKCAADGVALEAAEEVLPDPVVPNIVTSDKYRRLYGDDPLHMAVLEVYCRMAVLGGRLMGDNLADTTHMSELQMRDLADEARDFNVDHVDLLFGPAHTTKAHRLANHLLAALLGNGNLWEGDTSENEALHGPCKKMYTRTNRRGPTMVVQMMSAAEAQAEVLREIRELELEHADGDDGLHCLLENDTGAGDVAMNPTVALSRSHRGLRISVADAEQLPGMAGLGLLQSREASCSLVVSSSFTFHCTLEWGASSVVQTPCATESHLGRPRYDYILFFDESGQRQLGLASS